MPSGLTVDSFDVNFTVMATLKDLHGAGSGLVGVILPDTTSSVRYVNFDAPYLKKAFQAAGYSDSEYKIDNAKGDPAAEISLANADITQGAKVLIMDPLDSNTGTTIQQAAAAKGVKVISYDRATFTGTNTYYVSFNNVNVGKLIGQGFKDCVAAWNVQNAKVFTLNGGEDTDPNAVDFAKGYNSVVWGEEVAQETVGKSANGLTLVGDQVAPGWDNSKGQTIFQQQFTAHPEINATIEANDGLANAVITVLKQKGIAAGKIPTTGQDATLQGIENVLLGYQCGSVYKAVYLEAQAAVALATILRAGLTPPSALQNGTTSPASGKPGNTQPAILLTPLWVDKSKVASTVIKDNFVDKTALCNAVGASVCSANGIT
ncbi:MAG TPA: substrate-binding domain-containing protein [Candidatus Polarisedimenticolia bacterium]|nr:substrate-binding domain-containing protein [Candidatus Polarisedimenticolia bacterium]